MKPLVTVVTPTTGNPLLAAALDGVARQTYPNVQHLVVVDGRERSAAAREVMGARNLDVVELPYPTGTERFNGHRIYAAAAFLAKGDFIAYLDEDNWPEPDHIERLVDVVIGGADWAFSLRRIVLADGTYICNDDCESLGKWPSVHGGDDYLVDVSCFLVPKQLAVVCSPIWYRKAREPGVMEVDRALTAFLRDKAPNFGCSYSYSLNYRTDGTGLSVRPEFFIRGNAVVAKRYSGKLPWKMNAFRDEPKATPPIEQLAR